MNTPFHIDLIKTTIRESLEKGWAEGNTAFVYNRALTAAEHLEAHDILRGLFDADPSGIALPTLGAIAAEYYSPSSITEEQRAHVNRDYAATWKASMIPDWTTVPKT